MTLVDQKIEKREILNAYRRLVQSGQSKWSKSDRSRIRQAFEIAVDAHKDMRRKDGAPYILHPIAVAQIVAREIGLGPTSIICALLHDVVEDTEWTLGDIEREFDKKIASIIDGLTKISGVFDLKSSAQAENFRKLLLTLADDVRVILIKLSDRLHNMRTMDEMPRHKQLKISSETLFLYAPLAHRLGLYSIKTELEDLGMKYTEEEMYKTISNKLQETKDDREKYIRSFIRPLKKEIGELDLTFKIFGRSKHIYSIFNKIKSKDVTFEEVYDLFAIRIILDSPLETEKADCWRVYSLVTDHYVPKPDRLRDWISTPKANGYESLHTTVMGPQGRWVEVQIRSKQMDEVAEKGFAAHFKYKEGSTGTSSLDNWLVKIRELLQSSESNALDFINDFKLDLFEDEIYIFTPKGELKRMAVNSTALDFAYEIHTDIGNQCIGAKVNHKLVPLSYTLNNGDQVEIITSKKQRPSEDWLNFVTTTRARARIKSSLKDEMRKVGLDGKAMLIRKFKSLDIPLTDSNTDALQNYYHLTSRIDLYYQIAIKKINLKDLKNFENRFGRLVLPGSPKKTERLSMEETIKDTLQKMPSSLFLEKRQIILVIN